MGLTGEGCTPWYALQVVANHEKRVAQRLADRKIEAYLPAYTQVSRWSDRKVTLDRPLFPGYLFAVFQGAAETRSILDLPGLIRIVGMGDEPEPVPDSELDVVRALIASGYPLIPCLMPESGSRVRVIHGSMTGLEGTLVRAKDKLRVVVSLELLHRAVAVEIDADWIETLTAAKAAHKGKGTPQ